MVKITENWGAKVNVTLTEQTHFTVDSFHNIPVSVKLDQYGLGYRVAGHKGKLEIEYCSDTPRPIEAGDQLEVICPNSINLRRGRHIVTQTRDGRNHDDQLLTIRHISGKQELISTFWVEGYRPAHAEELSGRMGIPVQTGIRLVGKSTGDRVHPESNWIVGIPGLRYIFTQTRSQDHAVQAQESGNLFDWRIQMYTPVEWNSLLCEKENNI